MYKTKDIFSKRQWLPPNRCLWLYSLPLLKISTNCHSQSFELISLYSPNRFIIPNKNPGTQLFLNSEFVTTFSGGMSTVYQFVYSETTRMKGLLTPISRGWGSTPAYGMQITRQQEEDLKRSTGPVHPLLQNSVNLGQGLACGKDKPASVDVLPTPLLLIGILPLDTNSWVLLSLVN